jgi:Spy/CpxP family protein refolding chaperone
MKKRMMRMMSMAAAALAAVLAAISIGLAATALAAPSGPDVPGIPGPDTHQTGGEAHAWFSKPRENAYGTYQNDNTRQSGARR